ncbi:hypothetical protein BDZ97DRAFT_1839281 [Flammula alnicola]|nr:hypothetical protein BDZ97DRAFT_1839281 [Flammula alnicola]
MDEAPGPIVNFHTPALIPHMRHSKLKKPHLCLSAFRRSASSTNIQSVSDAFMLKLDGWFGDRLVVKLLYLVRFILLAPSRHSNCLGFLPAFSAPFQAPAGSPPFSSRHHAFPYLHITALRSTTKPLTSSFWIAKDVMFRFEGAVVSFVILLSYCTITPQASCVLYLLCIMYIYYH